MTSIHASTAGRLSLAAFQSLVAKSQPANAVFDCDGTLWKQDAGYEFMVWSIAEGIISRNAADWIDSRYRQYRAGEVSEIAMCGEMVQVYDGLREAEVRKAAAVFFKDRVAGTIFPEMRDMVRRLADSGAEVWAVSSTNNWVIEEGLHNFGIPASRVLAAEVRVIDGLITSELLDVPTDEGKTHSLGRAGISAPDAAFGNSIHDFAMLEAAKHPFPVNPTPELLRKAESRGWPVYFPQAILPDPR